MRQKQRYVAQKYLKHMKLLGYMPRKKGFKFKDLPYRSIIDGVARRLLNHTPRKAIVRPTRENYWLAVNMFDHPFTHPNGSFGERGEWKSTMFKYAVDLTINYFSAYIDICRPEYDNLKMDYDTNPGWPLNIYWNKKKDVPSNFTACDMYCKYEPYKWNLAMKIERLPIDKIMSGKMRSFMMPNMTYLQKQKIFSQNFNEQLKKVPWIAYGMNWHRKGWHKLMKPFEKFRYKDDWDVKYWDKRYPMKYWCYKVREAFLNLDTFERKLFWNIADDEINPTIVLPTGEVLKTESGQCSGSENTTTDNCVGHVIMTMYDIIKGYSQKFGQLPTLPVIMQHCHYAIYSDDVANAYDDTFDFLKDGKRKSDLYAEFGMLVEYENPEKYQHLETMEGIRFLGFKNKEFKGMYVPYYDYQSVKDSAILTLDNVSPKDQVQRFMALLELLTFSDSEGDISAYDDFKQFIWKYCDANNITRPFIQSQQSKQNYEMCKESDRIDDKIQNIGRRLYDYRYSRWVEAYMGDDSEYLDMTLWNLTNEDVEDENSTLNYYDAIFEIMYIITTNFSRNQLIVFFQKLYDQIDKLSQDYTMGLVKFLLDTMDVNEKFIYNGAIDLAYSLHMNGHINQEELEMRCIRTAHLHSKNRILHIINTLINRVLGINVVARLDNIRPLDIKWEGTGTGGRKISMNDKKSYSDTNLKTNIDVREALRKYECYKNSAPFEGPRKSFEIGESVTDFVLEEIKKQTEKPEIESSEHSSEEDKRLLKELEELRSEEKSYLDSRKKFEAIKRDSEKFSEQISRGNRIKDIRRQFKPFSTTSGKTNNQYSRRVPTSRDPPRIQHNIKFYNGSSSNTQRREGRRRNRKRGKKQDGKKKRNGGLMGKRKRGRRALPPQRKQSLQTKIQRLSRTNPQKTRDLQAIQHTVLLRNITSNTGMGVTRNMGYDTPMPMIQPHEKGRKDGVTVTGSEYLTSIKIYTSQSTAPPPTKNGDVLFWFPVNPRLLSGTRISSLSTLYQHYKYNYLVMEYVPSVPSIQDGAIGLFFSYDPVENWTFTSTDSDTLMRILMAHKGANISNVYSCLRTALVKDEDTLKDYFTETGEDFRNEDQANAIIFAASGFTPYDGSMTSVTLGNIIIHYSCTLHARDIEVGTTVNNKYEISSGGVDVQTMFATYAQYEPVTILTAWLTAQGIPTRPDGFYIIQVLGPLTTNNVQRDYIVYETQSLIKVAQGMVFFMFSTDSNGPLYLVPNEEDAAEKNTEKTLTWNTTQTATWTVGLNWRVTFVAF